MAESIADVIVQVETDLADVDSQITGLEGSLEGLGSKAEAVSNQLNLFNEAIMVPYADEAGQLNMFADALEPIGEKMEKLAESTASYSPLVQELINRQHQAEEAMAQAAAAVEELNAAMARGEDVSEALAAAEAHLSYAMRETGIAAGEVKGETGDSAGELIKMGLAMGGIALTAERAIEKLKEFITEAVNLAMEVQRTDESFEHFTGSKEKAEELTTALHQMSFALGEDWQKLDPLAQRMLAYNFTAEQTTGALRNAIGIHRELGTSLESVTNRMMMAASQGHISSRMLYAMGLDTKKVAEAMVELGDKTANVHNVTERFRELADSGQRMDVLIQATQQAGDFAKNTADDWESNVDRMKGAWKAFMLDVGNQAAPAFTKLVKDLSEAIYWFRVLNAALDTAGKLFTDFANYLQDSGKALHHFAMGMGYALIGEWTKAKDAFAEMPEEMNADLGKMKTDQEDYLKRIKQLGEEHKKEQEALAAGAEPYKPKGDIKVVPPPGQAFKDAGIAADEARKHEEALLNVEKQALELMKLQGLSAEDYHNKSITLIEREYNATIKANAAKRAAIGEEKNAAEERTKLAAADQAAADKRAEALTRENIRYAKQSIENERAVQDIRIKAADDAATHATEAARRGVEEQQKVGALSAAQAEAQLRQIANVQESMAEFNAVRDREKAIRRGEDRAKAEATYDEAIQKAREALDDTLAKLDSQAAEREAKWAESGQKAFETTQKGAEESAKNALQTQLRVDQTLAAAHLITQQQMLQEERDTAAQIQQIEFNSLTQRLEFLQVEQQAGKDHQQEIANIEQQIRGIRDSNAAADKERNARAAVDQEKLLGATTVTQYRNQLADMQDAYRQFVTANQGDSQAIAQANRALTEEVLKYKEAIGQASDAEVVALANIEMYQQSEKDRLEAFGNLYKGLQEDIYRMWNQWANGIAQAITAGKKFGDTLMNVLHQIEHQILNQIIGTALHKLTAELAKALSGKGGVLGSIGVFLGGKEDTSTKENTTAVKLLNTTLGNLNTSVNTLNATMKAGPAAGGEGGETSEDQLKKLYTTPLPVLLPEVPKPGGEHHAAAGGRMGIGGAMSAMMPLMELGMAIKQGTGSQNKLAASMSAFSAMMHTLTMVMHTTGKSHDSTTQANTKMGAMQVAAGVGMVAGLIGNITSNKTLQEVMMGVQMAMTVLTTVLTIKAAIPFLQEGGLVQATGAAVVHAGETVASSEVMKHVGANLSGGSAVNAPTSISFDGATFHGVPDQRYVNSIMDTAVRSLRNASRSWAFNPKGQ